MEAREDLPINRIVEQSYRHCRQIAQRDARNFYYSFLALSPRKRRSMCALYGFFRKIDDIGDGEGSISPRRKRLDDSRWNLDQAMQGNYSDALLPALHDTVQRYQIPSEYLHAVLDGVEMDLEQVHYDTFEQLKEYCYRVASVVGLACIHVWGFHGSQAEEYAIQSGIAFQLTNILRDIKEDIQRGRVYLPGEDLSRFQVSVSDLENEVLSHQFLQLMQFEVNRAREWYGKGSPLENCLALSSRPVFRTMRGIYLGILNEIERRKYDVFNERVALTPLRKTEILVRSFFRSSA